MNTPSKGWFKIRLTKCGALQMDFDGEIYLMDAEDMDLFVKHHPCPRHDGYLLSYAMGRTRSTAEAGFFHRLIWEKHNGPIPDGLVIDHINRDPKNNRKVNLRCVTQRVNTLNSDKRDNPDFGIYRRTRKNGTIAFIVDIKEHGKRVRPIKTFSDINQARSEVSRILRGDT